MPEADAKFRRPNSGYRRPKGIVEPVQETKIVRSVEVGALALQRVCWMRRTATVITVDCYGTMWRQLPAYPCLSHCRMNNLGYGGICESDLQSAMTHIIFQGFGRKARVCKRSNGG